MKQSAEYILSAYSFINEHPCDNILNIGYQSKEGNPIPSFDENVLIELCSEAKRIFEKEENILEKDGDFIIVGDIHGSFHDLLRILNYNRENNFKILFLGDYVDRGEFSLECITILFAMKVLHPNNFFLIRGNHEFDSMCSQYGFKNEILDYYNPKKSKEYQNITSDIFISKKTKIHPTDDKYDEYFADHHDMYCYKYTEKLYDAFIDAFSYLPISAILNKTTFCIHGGLSPQLEYLEYIQKGIKRPVNNFEDNKLLSDLVWSDPDPDFDLMFGANPRGRGYLFNTNAVSNFLNTNSLTRIIRAHQCVQKGHYIQFNKKCITVFSASSYDEEMSNSSGILKLFEKDDSVKSLTFLPLPRLRKCDAIYYKVQPFNSADIKDVVCFSLRHPKLAVNSSFQNSRIGKNLKIINQQQSHRNSLHMTLKKPIFVTNSRKLSQVIQKPLSHSISLEGFEDKENNNKNQCRTSSALTKSLGCIPKLADL